MFIFLQLELDLHLYVITDITANTFHTRISIRILLLLQVGQQSRLNRISKNISVSIKNYSQLLDVGQCEMTRQREYHTYVLYCDACVMFQFKIRLSHI